MQSKQNQSENILFFQGNDIVVPEGMSNENIAGITSADKSGGQSGWQTELQHYIASTAGPLTPEKILTLHGGGCISAVLLDDSFLLPAQWKRIPIRSAFRFAERIGAELVSEAQDLFRAYHILQWKKNTVFCGRCGGICKDSEKDTARICTSCGNIIFPRISPAVIVLITDDQDRILLARNKNFSRPFHSLLAGFVEAGESLEETVVREVKEEVDIRVDSVQYVRSQPWPFPDSIMLGFRAKYTGGELNPDGDEIKEAAWFSRGSLPEIPSPGSISRYLIDQWHNNPKNLG